MEKYRVETKCIGELRRIEKCVYTSIHNRLEFRVYEKCQVSKGKQNSKDGSDGDGPITQSMVGVC